MKNESLNTRMFDKVLEIFTSEPTISMDDFHSKHFVMHWPAGSPGFAGCAGDYSYYNNGDEVPSEPWDEDIVDYSSLQYVYEYFVNGIVTDIWGFIDWMLYTAGEYRHIWAYSNVHRQDAYDLNALYRRKYWKKASRKKVPKRVKRKFVHWFGNKTLREYYWYDDGLMYAVKHPKYNFWVTENGSILSPEWAVVEANPCVWYPR